MPAATSSRMQLDWQRLFPSGDYRFHLGLRPGDARAFFSASAENAALLAERGRWLDAAPADYAQLLPYGAELLEDAAGLAAEFGVQTGGGLIELGRAWEPDFVLLSGEMRVVGGVVCFPSAWALPEKLGRTLDETHGPVPGLNAALAPRIHAALAKLAPGAAWERENWGLARDAERNHHPARPRRRLDESITRDEVWLRVERQCLARLPRTGGLLFGIRLVIVPLGIVLAQPEAADGLRRSLESMPEEMAVYKGLARARSTVLSWIY